MPLTLSPTKEPSDTKDPKRFRTTIKIRFPADITQNEEEGVVILCMYDLVARLKDKFFYFIALREDFS